MSSVFLGGNIFFTYRFGIDTISIFGIFEDEIAMLVSLSRNDSVAV